MKVIDAPCEQFSLDVEATTFNICINCGAPRAAHIDFSRATDELKGKLGKRDVINNGADVRGASSASRACGNFRRDLSGATFDACVCGFPKSQHLVKALTHGAGDELARKLSKKTKSEAVEARRGPEGNVCAGCVVA